MPATTERDPSLRATCRGPTKWRHCIAMLSTAFCASQRSSLRLTSEHRAHQQGRMLAKLHRSGIERRTGRQFQNQCAKHAPPAVRGIGADRAGPVLLAEFGVRPRHLERAVLARGGIDHGGKLIRSLVHGRLERTDQIGLLAKGGAVRKRRAPRCGGPS